MNLPDTLIHALEKELTKISPSTLTTASADLTNRYRSRERDKLKVFITSDEHRLSYLATRMPATYAVVNRVLKDCRLRAPDFLPESLADIGAGPGTASWAALDVFPEIAEAVLYEKDSGWLNIGKRLMSESNQAALNRAIWKEADLIEKISFDPSDLVILSYVIGELEIEAMKSLISSAWNSTNKVLVVIEPGTPHGFERIRIVRDQLIESGAFLLAPCPHQGKCPMEKGDWCHFSERLERSAFHRHAKGASMGYEDEKFSYIAAIKSPVELPESRILRHPQVHSGHIDFTLCTKAGLEKRTISRRNKDLYKKAKKLEWGDVGV